MPKLSEAVAPYFETLLTYDEHPTGGVGFFCNICQRPVDDTPCPEHCPSDIPGLTKVECEASPPHSWWHPAGDVYPLPCFQCMYFDALPKPKPCAHWPWRRWKISRPVFGLLVSLHVVAGYGFTNGGPDHRWCMTGSLNYPGRTKRRMRALENRSEVAS